MCWAFEVDEGDLERLYWELSFYELTNRVKLKYGQLHATVLCHYTAVAEVASAVLGDGKGDGKDPDRADITAGAINGDQAIAMINGALNFG